MKKFLSKSNFCVKRTPESIKQKAESLGIKTITMGFPDLYGRYMGKKYDPDYFFDGVIKKGSNCCNYLLGSDIEMTPLPNAKLSSFELGYGDFMMRTDLESMREINYINGETQLLFFSDLYDIEDPNKTIDYAPRWLLQRAVSELEKKGIKLNVECDINFTAYLEKYRKNMNDLEHLTPITEHNNLANVFYSNAYEKLLSKISSSLKFSKVPVSAIYGDSGRGQFKICLDESSALTFSDNILLTKLTTKKLGDDNNMCFTYMAKYHQDTPGNAINLKLNFTDLKGKQLKAEEYEKIASGILKNSLDYSVIYGPTANSYKRFFEEEIQNNWNKLGTNNDINGVNLINHGDKTSIHFHLPGADVNPYLTIFSICHSAIYGLNTNASKSSVEKSLEGKKLPINLYEAIQIFDKSEIAQKSLGNDFHYHFKAFYTFEFQQYLNQITHWETERYLYSI